jgi:hypothetical protein
MVAVLQRTIKRRRSLVFVAAAAVRVVDSSAAALSASPPLERSRTGISALPRLALERVKGGA